MSLFDDIAHALGHTVETLALDVGTDVYELESVVNDLAGNGIDVFSIGDRFGLSTAGFLRSIVNILRGDPHEQLLGYITGPFKPVYALVEGLAAQWGQMAQFHQETAQMLNLHISEVLHGDGTFSYSGPAAETLWNTHLDYLSSLNTMVEHAQTQQRRYAVLGGHFGDFLGQAPGKVYGLSAPMAASQLANLDANITGNDPTDPVSQVIVGLFPSRAIDLKKRLDQKVGTSIGMVTDPFTVRDSDLNGWYPNLTGMWGEWAMIKQYYQQGKLVDYSIPISGGEVDIKIKEDNGTGTLVTKWVEVKNVQSVKNAWGKALIQVEKYITVDHATSVIIDLPQQGIRGNSGPSRQQQQLLQDLERQYSSVKFEVRMGSSDPRLQIPFDPPATNWGAYLP